MQASSVDYIKAGMVAARRFSTDETTIVMGIRGRAFKFEDTGEEVMLEFVSFDNRFGFYAAYVESRNILLVCFNQTG